MCTLQIMQSKESNSETKPPKHSCCHVKTEQLMTLLTYSEAQIRSSAMTLTSSPSCHPDRKHPGLWRKPTCCDTIKMETRDKLER